MDIWHTCEPDTLGTEGWLGKVVRELDPNKENVITAVSMGPSMFRALSVPGVPVACVDNLDSYGLMTNVEEAKQRERLLERYKRLYGPAVGSGPVMDFLGQTGLDALAGADILKIAPSTLRVQRGVRRNVHRTQAAEHRPDSHGRSRYARLLRRSG